MPNDKEKEPKADEEKKAAAPCDEATYPKEEKANEAAPKWALELGGKIDKLAEAIVNSASKADKYPAPDEEVKPGEEKKADKVPDEEKLPKDEKKQDATPPEKYPYGNEKKQKEPDKYPPEEKKFNDMIQNAVDSALSKSNIPDLVEKSIAKRFTGEEGSTIEKRGKVPGASSVSGGLNLEEFSKLSWSDVHALAKRAGA